MNTNVIGERLRYERQRLNMTLKDIGNLLKVSEQCVSGWEHGRNVPDIMTLNTLSKLFEIKIEDFLNMNVLPSKTKESNSKSSELLSSLAITKNDIQFLTKFHSLPKEKQQAIKILMGIPTR